MQTSKVTNALTCYILHYKSDEQRDIPRTTSSDDSGGLFAQQHRHKLANFPPSCSQWNTFIRLQKRRCMLCRVDLLVGGGAACSSSTLCLFKRTLFSHCFGSDAMLVGDSASRANCQNPVFATVTVQGRSEACVWGGVGSAQWHLGRGGGASLNLFRQKLTNLTHPPSRHSMNFIIINCRWLSFDETCAVLPTAVIPSLTGSVC